MKKLLALALAATMAAGMTTVAFAAQEEAQISGTDLYKIGTDDVASLTTEEEFEGGDQLAIPVEVYVDTNDDGDADSWELYDTSVEYDRNVVARADWRVGEAEVTTGWVRYSGRGNVYSVIITLPENETNTVQDVAGTISVGRTASAAKNSDVKFDFEVSYFSDATLTNTPNFDGGDLGDKPGIVSFDRDAGEIDIDFGDVATFTVDVTSQGKLNLAWNTDFNKEFGVMYDYANLTFVNFEGTPSFSKNGTLMVYAEPDTFFYEVTEDGAKKVDAEYDEDYEAWVLTTRTLSSYVVSDVELTEKTVTDTEDGSSTTDDGSKPIPDTGR